jgi:hypothetical protein
MAHGIKRMTDDEWKRYGAERRRIVDKWIEKIIDDTGYGDVIVQVRRDQGIIIKPQPWYI